MYHKSLLSNYSHCKQHAWKTRAERVKLSQRSVFNLNAEKKVKQEQQSSSENSDVSSIQLNKGDRSSQKSSEVTMVRLTKKGKKGKPKKKNMKMKKIPSRMFDNKNPTHKSMLEKMSDLSLPSTPASTTTTIQSSVEEGDAVTFNQTCEVFDESTSEEDMSDVENTLGDSKTVNDERKGNEISSSSEAEDDQDCNATSEDDEENQKENKGDSSEKYTTRQLSEVSQASVTRQREETPESEPSESERIPTEYTVCRAEMELNPVSLPLLDVNVIEKPFKPRGAKTFMVQTTEFCQNFVGKENTISSTEYSEKSNEKGAELLSNYKFSCDYTSDRCDMGTTEDPDEEIPRDNGGSPSGSSNNNEGAI